MPLSIKTICPICQSVQTHAILNEIGDNYNYLKYHTKLRCMRCANFGGSRIPTKEEWRYIKLLKIKVIPLRIRLWINLRRNPEKLFKEGIV